MGGGGKGGSSGGGSTTTTTNTIQKADPWVGQQPYLKDIFSEAQKQYQSAGPYYYPGDTIAQFSPQELQAQQSVQQYATGGARDLLNQGLQSQSFLLGDVLKADSNPYMADYAAGAISPVWDALTRVGLPSVNSGAIASGQYGGTRQGLAQGMALSDATRQSFDTTAKMYSDMYGKNLDAMRNATLTNKAVVEGGTLADQLLATVGSDRRAMSQALIDDALARWEWDQALPSAKLAQYVGAVQGNYGGQTSGTSTATSDAPNTGASTGQQLLGAGVSALGTYALYSAMGGAAATMAPWAAAAAGLMALM